ncbi:hypothetical protein MMC16_005514 [Acarospora aff. strigata]|nr:hypothetical protein [Acarospora aff. strigata]
MNNSRLDTESMLIGITAAIDMAKHQQGLGELEQQAGTEGFGHRDVRAIERDEG